MSLSVIVHYQLGKPKLPQVVTEYTENFYARTVLVEAALAEREYLVGGRFTIANIGVH